VYVCTGGTGHALTAASLIAASEFVWFEAGGDGRGTTVSGSGGEAARSCLEMEVTSEASAQLSERLAAEGETEAEAAEKG
jgi:hypothetical protein